MACSFLSELFRNDARDHLAEHVIDHGNPTLTRLCEECVMERSSDALLKRPTQPLDVNLNSVTWLTPIILQTGHVAFADVSWDQSWPPNVARNFDSWN